MSSNFFYIFFIFLSFLILYLITIYIQALFAFKKNYTNYKCNPMIMPFSSAFGESPIDVFNECLEAKSKNIGDEYTKRYYDSLLDNARQSSAAAESSRQTSESQAEMNNAATGTKVDVDGNPTGTGTGGGLETGTGGGLETGTGGGLETDTGLETSEGTEPEQSQSSVTQDFSLQNTEISRIITKMGATGNEIQKRIGNIMFGLGTLMGGVHKTIVSIANSPPMEVVKNVGALA